MSKNKFLLSLPLISLLLVSCGNNKDNISIFLYSNEDHFINTLGSYLHAEMSKEYNVNLYNGLNNQSIQNNQITNSIENDDSKLLIINSVDRLASKTIIQYANKYDKPVIFINRQPLESDLKDQEKIFYVGTNPIFEGESQANIVNDLFQSPEKFNGSKRDKNKDGIIDVVLLKGEQGHQDAEERSKNSFKRLRELGYEVNLMRTEFYDWSQDKAELEFEKIYADSLDFYGNSNIELILSNNDDMAIGCANFLTTLENYSSSETIANQYFPIIGVNGTDLGLNAVKYGLIFGTVKNDISMQVNEIVKIGNKLINNQNLDEYKNNHFIRTEGELITFERNFKK